MVIRKNLNASPEVLEYRPRWAAQSLFTFDGSIEPPSVLIDRGTAEVKLRQPRRIIVETFAEKPSFLEIRHLFYPGWYATIDGRTDSGLQVLPSHPEGLLSVFVPQGHHEVEVSLRRQPGERVGTAISAASAVIVILLFARMFITERRNHGA
jgi:hypothetical protein